MKRILAMFLLAVPACGFGTDTPKENKQPPAQSGPVIEEPVDETDVYAIPLDEEDLNPKK